MIKEYLNSLYNLVYPELCISCDSNPREVDDTFCLDCYSELPFANIANLNNNEFTKHFEGKINIEMGISLFIFVKQGKIQKIIKDLKYNNKSQYGNKLGTILAYSIQSNPIISTIDYIVPIPLHLKKERKRGYNQSLQIALGLSSILSIPINSTNLVRTKNTLSQTKMTREERISNIEDAFEIKQPNIFSGKHILIVDDVLTTGATLFGAGKTILKTNGTKISMATIAMGQPV